ncbi:MAG TPA: hypothetical protein VKV77_03050 [Methylovirgula sp.]|nr:hypothetical protein [Methylovirgula sp.]
MFFLIRCIFWLSVVFSTIFSQHKIDEPQDAGFSKEQTAERAKIGALARNWIGAALGIAERKAVESCGADCLVRLANLTQPSSGAAQPPSVEPRVQARWMPHMRAHVPLPPRRPIFLADR